MFRTNKCLTCQIAFCMKNIFRLRRRQKWVVLYILGATTTGTSYLYFIDAFRPLSVLFVYIFHSYASIRRQPHFQAEMEIALQTRRILYCKFDTAVIGGGVIFKSFPGNHVEVG